MYGYSEFVELNMEEVLKRVTQEEIYQMVLGYIPQEHQYIVSPFRGDNSPGCYFEWYNGWLWFIDWADPKHHRDCFNMLEDKLGLKFYDTLRLVNKHFNLGLGSNYSKPILTKELPEVTAKKAAVKEKHDITFKSRSFNLKQDKPFWGDRYEISKANLIEDNVFPVIWYKVYSKRLKDYVVIRPITRTYALAEFKGEVKIYTPDTKGKGKWVTNCSENSIGAVDKLPQFGDTLVITKSYKDCRVLRNQGINAIWFQNEGMMPSMEVLAPILSRFRKIYVLFDNDDVGINAAEMVADSIRDVFPEKEPEAVHIPKYLLKKKVKDPSDLIHRKGRQSLLNFLRKIGIIRVDEAPF